MPLIDWHQKRIDGVFKKWYPGEKPHELKSLVLDLPEASLHKLRFLYDARNFEIEIDVYHPKKIRSLQIVKTANIDYAYKYTDRIQLEKLFEQKGPADDIIIAVKGQPTDSYYANTCFFDGKEWYTPSTYLLNGVMRQSLLHAGTLKEREIQVEDVWQYEKVSLINALNPLGNIEISTDKITPQTRT